MVEQPQSRNLRFTFSLRALLVIVAIAAAPTAWIANERRQSQHEQQIAEQLPVLGVGSIEMCGPYDSLDRHSFDEPQGWWRDFARQVLGERIFEIREARGDFKDLTPLAGLANLESLGLYKTDVSDVGPLADLRSLQALDLQHTQVSDLTPLAGLTNLQELVLNDTRVRDVAPLAGLKNLRYLILDDTAASDLTPLAGLTSLEKLFVRRTQVNNEQVERLQKALPECEINR